jgi:hypothetical protein
MAKCFVRNSLYFASNVNANLPQTEPILNSQFEDRPGEIWTVAYRL